MKDEFLQAVGAITLVIVLLSGGWSVASATISMNSTGGVDTLKLLKILPSSGETVNVSTTFVINATSGDIIKMGKFTQDVTIEKDSARLKLDATTGNPGIELYSGGTIKGYLTYLPASDEWGVFDSGGGKQIAFNVSTGDITKIGAFTTNVEIEKVQPDLTLDATSGAPRLLFDLNGVPAGGLQYKQATEEYAFLNTGRTDYVFTINSSTGDIAKMGKFTQDVEIEKSAPLLTLSGTDSKISLDGYWSSIDFNVSGSAGYKQRLLAPYFGYVAITDNADYNGTDWNRDDTSKNSWRLQFGHSENAFNFYYAGASANPISWTNLFSINSTGDITKVGGITVGNSSTTAQGTLKSNSTGLYVSNGTDWLLIKAY